MSKEIPVEKLRAGDVPYLRRDYLELIEKDFAQVPDIGEKQRSIDSIQEDIRKIVRRLI